MNRRNFTKNLLTAGAISLTGINLLGETARSKLKITNIEVLPIDSYLFVKVYTDAGITGLGESGAWGFLEASGAAIESFKKYLIGQDPLRIEHHWQYMYRSSHFTGAAIMGAISAIDIALWDIAGKYFGVPCYELPGRNTLCSGCAA
jgi:galactonate dehydratase